MLVSLSSVVSLTSSWPYEYQTCIPAFNTKLILSILLVKEILSSATKLEFGLLILFSIHFSTLFSWPPNDNKGRWEGLGRMQVTREISLLSRTSSAPAKQEKTIDDSQEKFEQDKISFMTALKTRRHKSFRPNESESLKALVKFGPGVTLASQYFYSVQKGTK